MTTYPAKAYAKAHNLHQEKQGTPESGHSGKTVFTDNSIQYEQR